MREMKEAVIKALEVFHCSDYEFVMGGKHPKVILRSNRGQRTIAFSATPSCQFAPKKLSRNVRHALKELGYAP